MSRHVTGAREVAGEVLVRVATTAAFADVLLGARLARTRLSAADRRLATELVYGTLTWQGRLDHHLAGLVHGRLDALEPGVLVALRMGLFQLLFLDRVPDHAAVDASVRLVRRLRPGATGLVNAVLRRAARAGRAGLPLPDAADPIGRLAVEWSHPRWLVERWAAELPADELIALLAADNRRGRTALRPNRLRTTPTALRDELAQAGVGCAPGVHAADAVVVERGAGGLRGLAAYREGRFAFQGEASQLVAGLAAPDDGGRVLDACAGTGGKALALAEASMGVVVVALDLHRAGLVRLRAEARRLGVERVVAVAGDARRLPTRGEFDAVLVDAPCSGLGTLRRHPELRWRRQPADIARLAVLQQEILDAAGPHVRRGGTLVYAVCTRTREETTDVVARLLARQPRFDIEPCALAPDGFLRTAPHTHDLDGFFAVRLRARR